MDNNDQQDWRWRIQGRSKELQFLIDKWNSLASTKRNDGLPAPKAVVISGPEGIGKTRIVQEFYSWLSNNEDTKEYWPKVTSELDFVDGVHPKLKPSESSNEEIPWLWWGIKVPSERNGHIPINLLTASRISVHTSPIAAYRKIGSAPKKILRRMLGPSIVTLMDQVTFGTASIISMLVDAIVQTKKERDALKETSNKTAYELSIDSDSDAYALVGKLFQSMLDPTEIELPQLPVVLFIDDAQFLDEKTLDFIKDLWRSAAQGWPLFLILTHWDHEALEKQKVPRRVENLLNELNIDSNHHLALRPLPIEDMGKVLAQSLPGLRREHQQRILRHVDGNPRLLQDTVEYALISDYWFEEDNNQNALTEEGIESMLQHPTRLLESAILRLKLLGKKHGQHLLEAVAVSSLQGSHFFRDITIEMCKSVKSDIAIELIHQGLELVEGRLRHIRSLSNRADLDWYGFNQAVFLRAAENILQELPKKNIAAYKSRLLMVLNNIMSDEWIYQECDTLEEQESKRDVLLMVILHLKEYINPDSKIDFKTGEYPTAIAWGRAVARLADIDLTMEQQSASKPFAERFIKLFPQGLPLDQVDGLGQLAIAEILIADANLNQLVPLLLRFIEQTLPKVRELSNAEQSQSSIKRLSRVLRLTRKMTHTQIHKYGTHAMMPTIRQFLDISLAAVLVMDNLETRHNLWYFTSLYGIIFKDERKYIASYRMHLRALRVARIQIKNNPGVELAMNNIVESQNEVADLIYAENCPQDAIELYQSSIKMARKIIADFGESPDRLSRLAASYGKLERTYYRHSEYKKCIAALESQMKILEQTEESYGATIATQVGRINNYREYGYAAFEIGQYTKSNECALRAIQLIDNITKRFGASGDVLMYKQGVLFLQACLLRREMKYSLAHKFLKDSWDIVVQLESDPERAAYVQTVKQSIEYEWKAIQADAANPQQMKNEATFEQRLATEAPSILRLEEKSKFTDGLENYLDDWGSPESDDQWTKKYKNVNSIVGNIGQNQLQIMKEIYSSDLLKEMIAGLGIDIGELPTERMLDILSNIQDHEPDKE